jgi:dTDP-4-dehydrorhamnose 3,5-epimerase
MSEKALFSYKCTDYYAAECDSGIAWNDPDIGIEWPIADPVLSQKDAKNPRLSQVTEKNLPTYNG